MQKTIIKFIFVMLIIMLTGLLPTISSAEEKRVVVDQLGRSVTIPQKSLPGIHRAGRIMDGQKAVS